jgi:hypothetical protein
MKSIKNQYIDLKEGKMSEAQFMRNVRMTLPEYISNVTLFKQAERILINKGIISEIKDTSATGYYNQDGKEQYSKFDELDNMNAQEIMAGYVMEKQDNPNIDQKEAVKLVIKNLKSDQFYYTNYKLTGIRGLQPTEFTSTKRKPFFDEMEEINKNGDNFVDEKNKMIVVKENQEATIGNPSFSGKTKKVKVGDKAELQGEEVEITKIDYVKPGSGATSNKIIAKTKDGKQVSAKAIMFKPLDEAKIEDVKLLLSDETLENSKIGDSNGGVSIIYNDFKKLPYEDLDKLRNSFIVDEDKLSDEGETEVYQYYLSDKMNEVMKPDSKLKLKELVRKMMKEMFDGRDNLTDIE